MRERRYTGLVISHGENREDTYFDMMLTGCTFRLMPIIEGGCILQNEMVRVRILQVHVHPKYPAVLVVFKTVEVNEERMSAGTYALVFREGLVCENIPSQPIIDKDVADPELLVDNIRACVQEFSEKP